jgi:hypothetical protein
MKGVVRFTSVVLFVVLAAELVVRASGAVAFPTYVVDKEIGYIPKPNQAGSFLRSRDWVFNDRSMGTGRGWSPSGGRNLLLIGNSIVMGGNPFQQKDKVGPLLEKELGNVFVVWPIAAGGWTDVNETVYLNRNPDIAAKANFFIWEFMSGGLSEGLTEWRSDYVLPREKPLWASWYVFRRYILPRIVTVDNELPHSRAANPEFSAKFEAAVSSLSHAVGLKCPGILFIFPRKAEYLLARQGKEWLPERREIEKVAKANGLMIVDVSRAPEWNEGLYRDRTHPTVQGNIVLAKFLAAAVKQVGGSD